MGKEIFTNEAGIIIPPHLKEAPKTAPVIMVFFRSLDSEASADQWEPVKTADVPDFVKEEQNVKYMNAGHCMQDEAKDPHWWGAKRMREGLDMPPSGSPVLVN